MLLRVCDVKENGVVGNKFEHVYDRLKAGDRSVWGQRKRCGANQV